MIMQLFRIEYILWFFIALSAVLIIYTYITFNKKIDDKNMISIEEYLSKSIIHIHIYQHYGDDRNHLRKSWKGYVAYRNNTLKENNIKYFNFIYETEDDVNYFFRHFEHNFHLALTDEELLWLEKKINILIDNLRKEYYEEFLLRKKQKQMLKRHQFPM